jgi:hypothetical protein
VLEDELIAQGVEKYSFDHTKKHAALTWFLNGHVKFYTFPKTSPSQRAIKNFRSEVRRYCREMKAKTTGNRVGLA